MDKDQPPLFAEGGCLCGAVRYRISGTPVSSSVCRCRSCRLAIGAPGVVHKDHYQLLQGHPASHHSSREIWLEHRIAWEAVNPHLPHHLHDSGEPALPS